MIGIYKWTNKINQKSYIGQSINIQERQKKHIAASYYPKSNTYNTAFHKAIRKYGVDQFDFDILCICKVEELDVLEKFYIEKFNSFVPNGYNMTTGGENPRCCNHRYSEEDIQNKFEFLVNAFKYGTPPHGGLAIGLDRLVALLLRAQSIREVIAFPKNSAAKDLMTDAPSLASEEQLRELHLKLRNLPKV